MSFADELNRKAKEVEERKFTETVKVANERQSNDAKARLEGAKVADENITEIRKILKNCATVGEFKFDLMVGESDSKHSSQDKAFLIGTYQRTKELLIEDGFKVTDNVTGNAYDYDGDGNSHGYHSWYELKISW
jgi:hypothetical protein